MKKIFNVFILALAMSLAFTGCASKKAKESKGPNVYTVDLASLVSVISLSEEAQAIDASVFLPEGTTPLAGEGVKVRWSFTSDTNIDKLYIS